MRVLVLTNLWPNPQVHFAGTFIVSRVQHLVRLGVDVTLCHLHYKPLWPGESAPSWQALNRLREQITELPAYRPSWYAYGGVKLSLPAMMESGGTRHVSRHACAAPRFDVVHAHGMYVPSAGVIAMQVAQQLRVPYVLSLHGGDVNSAQGRTRADLRRVVGSAAAVSFVSEALRTHAGSLGAVPNRAVVIPNGVDLERFKPEVAGEPAPPGGRRPRVVGYLGHLTAIKGADRLVDIMKLLTDADVRLLVGGRGHLDKSLRQRSSGLPIDFVGPISPGDVPRFMRSLDLLVVPSRSEGWPTVILEAHACGVPVLGSDAGGTADAIGDSTYVVPNGEDFERRFAERLCEVLENKADPHRLRRRAEEYSWRQIAVREAEMLQTAAGSTRGAQAHGR
ncbi:Glycosyltransferase involved in cell wall bisynthesis [Actinopolymorpha cephalotaxi]|uniref:Glycosyltransferase involved in cell wall biosynthesis n=1 Tax=Actinopolymorpha cephalotaxi TaxID=504797 RepID=A0A1I2T850_9ACTN|nr:glycosyltransferase [Actinopolymorpha cephalotaxi]NYH82971.1 glycosyltransferase involved in cell wall biosynthesis [Actinopolymorpha cephalotaxi]SFG61153.1 Glycosyltransferase involved in cell wall bisynthesis [Actinopolymorpha cephalotaxi]